MGRNENEWNTLVTRVGDDDARLNTALMAAMTAYQARWGFLPGGHDYEEANDLFGMALANYATATN